MQVRVRVEHPLSRTTVNSSSTHDVFALFSDLHIVFIRFSDYLAHFLLVSILLGVLVVDFVVFFIRLFAFLCIFRTFGDS